MKKIIITLAFILFAITSIAQTSIDKKPSFWFGPKVGMDLLTPTLDQNSIKSQVENNYQAGIFLQFGRKFYVQPEFYYATQKQKIGTVYNTINTAKVPLMFGMRLVNLKVISAHIMAGPSLSYLLSETNPNTDPDRKKANFALQAGGGVDLLGFITLDVRYSVDLNNSTNSQIKQLSWSNGVNATLGIKLR